MNWALVGLVYAGAYVAVVSALGDRADARLLIGNVALLIPPIAPILVMFWRRGHWRGRQAVFWGAIVAWPILWLIGQVGWSIDEVFRSAPLPWFRWHIIPQLCGSALPLIALVAWPHRGTQRESAVTAAVDVAVLVFLAGFLLVVDHRARHGSVAFGGRAAGAGDHWTDGPLRRVDGSPPRDGEGRRDRVGVVYQRLA
jgi:hypothetical protein